MYLSTYLQFAYSNQQVMLFLQKRKVYYQTFRKANSRACITSGTILADQLTNPIQTRGWDYAHHITTYLAPAAPKS